MNVLTQEGVWQFVNERGNITHPNLPEFAHKKDEMRAMYRAMVLTRVFDKTCLSLNRTGKIGTVASAEGQEAVGVGTAYAMKKHDVLVPGYRDQAAMFCRNVSVKEVLLFWKGDERGSDFKNSNDFPPCIPIGTQTLHAAGAAYASALKKTGSVVVCTLGDGGTSRGDFYESLNFSGVFKLPVVFIVNNNQYAISVPLKKQTAAQTLAQKGVAAGVPGVRVDGNDCIAVRYVVKNAIEYARSGKGPVVVEALTYRLCDHTTADDASRYRTEEELEHFRKKEPLVRMRKGLEHRGWWSEIDEQECFEDCEKELEKAVEEMFTLLSDNPRKPSDPFNFLFEKMPKNIARQAHACETHEGGSHE